MTDLEKHKLDEKNPNRLPDKLKEVLRAQRAALAKTKPAAQEQTVRPLASDIVSELSELVPCVHEAACRACVPPATATISGWQPGVCERSEKRHLRSQSLESGIWARRLCGYVGLLCSLSWVEKVARQVGRD